MSILKVNTIQDKGGNTIISSDGSGTITPSFGTGKIGQVVNTVAYTQQAFSTASFTDLTDMTLAITPSSASSKILAMVHLNGVYVNNSSGDAVNFKLVVTPSGGSLTDVAYFSNYGLNGLANGESGATFSITSLYQVSSAIEHTFKVQGCNRGSATSFLFNTNNSSNLQLNENSTNSTITLMEVLA